MRRGALDVMRREGFTGPNVCIHCLQAHESVDHLFLYCNLVRTVWAVLFEKFQVPFHDFASFAQLLLFAMG